MRTGYIALPLAAIVTGCGTIDQVPLVYVSTVKVGVSAESGTPQVPGAKVVIGVDATDAAMVPVAYGRTCNHATEANCGKDDHPIKRIFGQNDISPAEFLNTANAQAAALKSISDRIRSSEKALQEAIARQIAASSSLEKLKLDEQRLEQLNKKITNDSIAPAGVDPALAPPVDTAMANEIVTLRSSTAALPVAQKEFTDADTSVIHAQGILKAAYDDFERQQAMLSETLARHPSELGQRKDALSVFGSFNTTANGSTAPTGAGLTLGKSFSTGIAAQLLSEGLKGAARYTAAQKCLDTAKTMSLDKEDILKLALAVCKVAAEKN